MQYNNFLYNLYVEILFYNRYSESVVLLQIKQKLRVCSKVKIIGLVRYINILAWRRDLRGKLLYLVLFSLHSSLFWEGTIEALKIDNFYPKASEPCWNTDISSVAHARYISIPTLILKIAMLNELHRCQKGYFWLTKIALNFLSEVCVTNQWLTMTSIKRTFRKTMKAT